MLSCFYDAILITHLVAGMTHAVIFTMSFCFTTACMGACGLQAETQKVLCDQLAADGIFKTEHVLQLRLSPQQAEIYRAYINVSQCSCKNHCYLCFTYFFIDLLEKVWKTISVFT